MTRTMEILHRLFAIGVALATVAGVLDLLTRPEASLLEDLDAIFAVLTFGALLEMIGLVLLEGYKALQRRA